MTIGLSLQVSDQFWLAGRAPGRISEIAPSANRGSSRTAGGSAEDTSVMSAAARSAAPSANHRWSPADIGDLGGVSAIVTGANSGLGLRTAVRLAEHGAEVVLACRSLDRGRAAMAALLSEVPTASAELRELDLADLASVRRFVAVWADRRLDLLVNNAGVMATPRRVTVDGFELQLATNHLGHFALTGLLLPILMRGSLAGGPARVVTLSSFVHRIGRLHVNDLMREHGYSPWKAYGQSKLANLLFMRELQRRADDAAVRLASLAAHPGYAATNLQQVGPQMSGKPLTGRLTGIATSVLAQSAEQGAWPTLRAASDPLARSGEFFGPGGFAEQRGAPKRVGMSSRALDPVAASWLWERSVDLTGVEYVGLKSTN
jgi:NAD(P)-dependent dehydrogenase (short-subunit alcohol dehydrogenase family)